jgi:hypothetical protein
MNHYLIIYYEQVFHHTGDLTPTMKRLHANGDYEIIDITDPAKPFHIPLNSTKTATPITPYTEQ